MVPKLLLMHLRMVPSASEDNSSLAPGQVPQALTQVPWGLLCDIPGQHVQTPPGASLSAPTWHHPA